MTTCKDCKFFNGLGKICKNEEHTANILAIKCSDFEKVRDSCYFCEKILKGSYFLIKIEGMEGEFNICTNCDVIHQMLHDEVVRSKNLQAENKVYTHVNNYRSYYRNGKVTRRRMFL